jgi:hypothetical protein
MSPRGCPKNCRRSCAFVRSLPSNSAKGEICRLTMLSRGAVHKQGNEYAQKASGIANRSIAQGQPRGNCADVLARELTVQPNSSRAAGPARSERERRKGAHGKLRRSAAARAVWPYEDEGKSWSIFPSTCGACRLARRRPSRRASSRHIRCEFRPRLQSRSGRILRGNNDARILAGRLSWVPPVLDGRCGGAS